MHGRKLYCVHFCIIIKKIANYINTEYNITTIRIFSLVWRKDMNTEMYKSWFDE